MFNQNSLKMFERFLYLLFLCLSFLILFHNFFLILFIHKEVDKNSSKTSKEIQIKLLKENNMQHEKNMFSQGGKYFVN